MEYVDGMTLRQLLASGRRLLPERALEITAGILAGLDYAHRHGIVHRDIKPANAMLTRTGDVKVMDFGIARAMNDVGTTMTATSAVMGTAQYLSPEQARGEVVDARSDLYSTGVLLYELLTGRPPFTGDSPVSIAYQHVSEMPVPPSQVDPGVTPEVDSVVLHALAKRTEDRYQTAADFRADVERAIAGSPVTAAVPMVTADRTQMMAPVQAAAATGYEPMYDTDRPRRRRGAGFWALSLVGVVAAIIGALLIGRFVFGGPSVTQVQVPNLDGLTIEQATSALQDYELRLGAQTPATSDRPIDTIIAQQPAAGESIEQGQSVNVTVSSGLEQVTVPQLVALTSVEAARIALQDASLVLGGIKERNSQQPAGYVLEQAPEEGTQVDAGLRRRHHRLVRPGEGAQGRRHQRGAGPQRPGPGRLRRPGRRDRGLLGVVGHRARPVAAGRRAAAAGLRRDHHGVDVARAAAHADSGAHADPDAHGGAGADAGARSLAGAGAERVRPGRA